MHPTSSNDPTIVGVDIFGASTHDATRLIAFYRDVLGMVPTAIDADGLSAEFTLPDGTTFGIRQMDALPSGGGYGALFAVDDIHGAVGCFRARGAEIMDPLETPVCYIAFGRDPDGNRFGLHERKVS